MKNLYFIHPYINLSSDVTMPYIIQSRFSAYSLISTSKNYSIKGLRFYPCTTTSIYYSLQLLKIAGYKECYLFFKLIKGALSGLRKFLAFGSPLRIMKNAFLFHLKSSLRSQVFLVIRKTT